MDLYKFNRIQAHQEYGNKKKRKIKPKRYKITRSGVAQELCHELSRGTGAACPRPQSRTWLWHLSPMSIDGHYFSFVCTHGASVMSRICSYYIFSSLFNIFFFSNKHINIQLHFFKRCSTCHSFLMPENSCPPCATFWSSYPLLLGASASAGLAEDTTLALFHSLNSHRLSNTVYWTQLLGLRFIPPQDDGFPFTTDKKQNTK